MEGSLELGVIWPSCSSDRQAILQRRRLWRESALEARSKTRSVDGHLCVSGLDEGGVRTAESGEIKQMGADRIQLDPVEDKMFHGVPWHH